MIGEAEFIAHPRLNIKIGKLASATIVEEYFSFAQQSYMMNAVSNICLEAGAKLIHYKIQHEGEQAVHVAHTFIEQNKIAKLI